MPEKKLGNRYTIQDKIGTGGMAIVYRGLDEVLGRTVAVKTMLPQYAADASFAARFKQEAQAAAALQSPYIVNVYDWGQDGDTYYIVMEYLRGTDLKSGIRKHGALDCRKVAQIGSQIAQALTVAHRHDIIHRDIKPQNIMVQPDGNIKVMDFGIARAKNSHLTQDNSVLGTAHYVSPEQTQGKDLGPTTDIYSLGVVMYEAATGSVPFDGDDAISVALKQVNEQPMPPSQRNPKVDASLESIILKCMQKNPANRFQSAEELFHVLRDYLSGRIQAVSTATARLSTLPLENAATSPLSAAPSNTKTTPRQRPAAVSPSGTRMKPQTATELARQEAEQAERDAKRKRAWAAIAALLLVVAFCVGLWSIASSMSSRRSAPDLVGQTQTAALEAIEATDWFERGTVTQEYNEDVAIGVVADQDPDASDKKYEKGTEINLVISKGPKPAETVEVPDLTGMTPSEASAALNAVNLSGQTGDSVYSDTVEAGKIAEQNPAAGSTVKAGEKITYSLSMGVETVAIESYVGKSESELVSAIQNSGVNAEISYQNSDSVAKGVIISQSASGDVPKGATIKVVVSSGPAAITVPNVVGYTQDAAVNAIESAGLSYQIQTRSDNSTPQGNVIEYSPTGETERGTTVTLYISSGPSQQTTTDNTGSGTNSSSGDTSSNSGSGGSTNPDNGSGGTDSSYGGE